MNRTSSRNDGARPPCSVRSTRWNATKPTMSVMMMAMRVFSMRGDWNYLASALTQVVTD